MDSDKVKEYVDEVLDCNLQYEESQKLYSQWAQSGKYEEMLQSQKVYAGPFVLQNMLKRLYPTPCGEVVLDLGAGTGKIGDILNTHGFKHIDALEPCPDFLETLQKKKLYQRIMEQCVGDENTIDTGDDTYDVIVTVGTFCAGHIPCNALYELIRVIKPGGYFINCMRESFLTLVPEYNNRLEPLMEQLEKETKWKKVAWEKYDHHFMQEGGIIMVFQIC